MLIKECLKCESKKLTIKETGTQKGLYCSECGNWLKWINKKEYPEYIKMLRNNQENTNAIDYINSIRKNIVDSLVMAKNIGKIDICTLKEFNSNITHLLNYINNLDLIK